MFGVVAIEITKIKNMKRCDLHIHTIPTVSDRDFKYDKSVLSEYVKKQNLMLSQLQITIYLTLNSFKK